MNCCLCEHPGEVTTPFIEGASYSLCRKHFNLFVRTSEDIGMWAWCKRATTAWIIVREDDTMVCEPCYVQDCEEASPFDLPQHRWSFSKIDSGICESCGAVVDAGVLLDTGGESAIQSQDPDRRCGDGDEFARRFPYADQRKITDR